ncbi:Transcriptional regulatory protein DevR (DosR) [compost metagenome]
MRILIIEDEIIIARFIEQHINASFPHETAIAINNKEVEKIIPKFLPDLILCDINLNEEQNGIQLIRKMQRNFSFEVVYITSYQSKVVIESALVTKPLNYVIKPIDEGNIYAAIKLAEASLQSIPKNRDKQVIDLPIAGIEVDIVRLILDEKTTKQIAEVLFLSPYTVKNYRHRICRKLNLKDENNALLKWALQNEDLIR